MKIEGVPGHVGKCTFLRNGISNNAVFIQLEFQQITSSVWFPTCMTQSMMDFARFTANLGHNWCQHWRQLANCDRTLLCNRPTAKQSFYLFPYTQTSTHTQKKKVNRPFTDAAAINDVWTLSTLEFSRGCLCPRALLLAQLVAACFLWCFYNVCAVAERMALLRKSLRHRTAKGAYRGGCPRPALIHSQKSRSCVFLIVHLSSLYFAAVWNRPWWTFVDWHRKYIFT